MSVKLCSVGSSVAGGVADDFIKTAATDAANAANSILQTLVTAWTAVPTQLGGAQAVAATSLIQGDLLGIEVWVGVLGVIVGAARMALFRRGEPFRQVVSGLLNMIVIGGAGVVAINLLATAGDNFSNYLLSNGFGQANAAFDLGLAAVSAPFLLLILSILAIVSLLVQVALIILRSALLVVLTGVWPVAAAASMTSAGAQWFRRLNGWIVAFLLYKPAAAVCYAAAFQLLAGTAGGGTSVIGQIEGVVLIILATLTLPALLRFVVPLVSSVGGISTGEVRGDRSGPGCRCRGGRCHRGRCRPGRWCRRRRNGKRECGSSRAFWVDPRRSRGTGDERLRCCWRARCRSGPRPSGEGRHGPRRGLHCGGGTRNWLN